MAIEKKRIIDIRPQAKKSGEPALPGAKGFAVTSSDKDLLESHLEGNWHPEFDFEAEDVPHLLELLKEELAERPAAVTEIKIEESLIKRGGVLAGKVVDINHAIEKGVLSKGRIISGKLPESKE